jgi:DNA invertase Pin-like site-specific DNA recombinase
VVQETASGAKTDRPLLGKLVGSLRPGDVLVVTRLDRLARSTIDLLTLLKALGDRQASFQSLGEQWADTTTAAGRLMLTILGGLAEFERELIKARTAEGRERAKSRGVRMGRKHKLTPHRQRRSGSARPKASRFAS